jgi:ABC-type multidrug transport system ATPase subunit
MQIFVYDIMELLELTSLQDAYVGHPGETGLSSEQRKRLTIAVELVSNPSIIFMDEPTSRLDARAAAIVMRTIGNLADTGKTVVCTIHQPSIEILETFDEVIKLLLLAEHIYFVGISDIMINESQLLLMKQGGEEIYVGPLGDHSSQLINYFEVS